MSDEIQQASGGCYCGRVRYRARGLSREVVECHCSQCRKQSGHRYASTGTKWSDIEIQGADTITWFRASPDAERGFCSTCGSHLFWRSSKEDYMAVLAASLDEPSGLRVTKHIFIESRGDYYEITDGLPQFEGYDQKVREG